MGETKKVNAVVVGKWLKKGWFSEKAMLSIRVDSLKQPYHDIEAKRAFWFSCEKGTQVSVSMIKDDNDLWYFQNEEI